MEKHAHNLKKTYKLTQIHTASKLNLHCTQASASLMCWIGCNFVARFLTSLQVCCWVNFQIHTHKGHSVERTGSIFVDQTIFTNCPNCPSLHGTKQQQTITVMTWQRLSLKGSYCWGLVLTLTDWNVGNKLGNTLPQIFCPFPTFPSNLTHTCNCTLSLLSLPLNRSI